MRRMNLPPWRRAYAQQKRRGARAADVEVAGGTWREAGANHGAGRGKDRHFTVSGSAKIRIPIGSISSAVEHSPHTGGATGSSNT
mgnify:CR=1 FL=1